ncbi:hypothetical protein EON65_22840 [archaeon]|nr:MAG: hypothetical protein EON65_22840 [archaeon]
MHYLQLYVYKDRSVTLDLVRRAEQAGYKAIAVTVDTPLLGRREADIRNRFTLPSHLTMGNFEGRYGGNNRGDKRYVLCNAYMIIVLSIYSPPNPLHNIATCSPRALRTRATQAVV